jgi:hypothetical protein
MVMAMDRVNLTNMLIMALGGTATGVTIVATGATVTAITTDITTTVTIGAIAIGTGRAHPNFNAEPRDTLGVLFFLHKKIRINALKRLLNGRCTHDSHDKHFEFYLIDIGLRIKKSSLRRKQSGVRSMNMKNAFKALIIVGATLVPLSTASAHGYGYRGSWWSGYGPHYYGYSYAPRYYGGYGYANYGYGGYGNGCGYRCDCR